MSEVMTRTVEGTHIIFLRHIMGKRARRNTYGTWVIPEAVEVLRSVGMQTEATF